MPALEIPHNVTTFEQVAAHIERRGRQLTDFYYNHLGLEVHDMPYVVEHEYYLQFGMDFDDPRPWKSRTWYIPEYQEEEACENVLRLRDRYLFYPYYEQNLRRKWELHYLFIGPHQDERGIALVDAQPNGHGRVNKITHRRSVQKKES